MSVTWVSVFVTYVSVCDDRTSTLYQSVPAATIIVDEVSVVINAAGKALLGPNEQLPEINEAVLPASPGALMSLYQGQT